MAIDLLKFCARQQRNQFSEKLNQWVVWSTTRPFAHDGWMYATDNAILVRVKTDEPDTSSREGEIIPKAYKMFEAFPSEHAQWDRWRSYPLVQHSSTCPECDGTGQVECDRCGHVAAGCTKCDGLGVIEKAKCRQIGFVMIAMKYDQLIRSLPKVECVMPTDADAPVAFRFEGGEGLVMPMAQEV